MKDAEGIRRALVAADAEATEFAVGVQLMIRSQKIGATEDAARRAEGCSRIAATLQSRLAELAVQLREKGSGP